MTLTRRKRIAINDLVMDVGIIQYGDFIGILNGLSERLRLHSFRILLKVNNINFLTELGNYLTGGVDLGNSDVLQTKNTV